MRERDDRSGAVLRVCTNGVVRHVRHEVHGRIAEVVQEVLARVTHRDLVVEHERHVGEVLAHHAGADDEQLKAGSVGMGEDLCVVVPGQLGVLVDGFDRRRLGLEINSARGAPTLVERAVQGAKVGERCVARCLRFDHDVEMSATRQTQLFGLFRGDAVLEELRAVGRELTVGELFEQVVLDAPTREGADELAAAIARKQRADRPR